jgi:hypothetical protein
VRWLSAGNRPKAVEVDLEFCNVQVTEKAVQQIGTIVGFAFGRKKVVNRVSDRALNITEHGFLIGTGVMSPTEIAPLSLRKPVAQVVLKAVFRIPFLCGGSICSGHGGDYLPHLVPGCLAERFEVIPVPTVGALGSIPLVPFQELVTKLSKRGRREKFQSGNDVSVLLVGRRSVLSEVHLLASDLDVEVPRRAALPHLRRVHRVLQARIERREVQQNPQRLRKGLLHTGCTRAIFSKDVAVNPY